MAPTYTGISVTSAARDAARRMAAAATGQTGQRLSLSDALRIAEQIMAAHLTEIRPVAIALGIVHEEGADQ